MARKQAAKEKASQPVIPLRQRPGYCRNCASDGPFRLKFIAQTLTRICASCEDHLKL